MRLNRLLIGLVEDLDVHLAAEVRFIKFAMISYLPMTLKSFITFLTRADVDCLDLSLALRVEYFCISEMLPVESSKNEE
jgi:hypothetical protein